MPQFRYDGFGDIIYRDAEDKNPVLKGKVGTFSQKFVDFMTERGHTFTAVDEMTSAEKKDAEEVAPAPALVTSEDQSRKPK